jgi:hypothetical protein
MRAYTDSQDLKLVEHTINFLMTSKFDQPYSRSSQVTAPPQTSFFTWPYLTQGTYAAYIQMLVEAILQRQYNLKADSDMHLTFPTNSKADIPCQPKPTHELRRRRRMIEQLKWNEFTFRFSDRCPRLRYLLLLKTKCLLHNSTRATFLHGHRSLPLSCLPARARDLPFCNKQTHQD